MSIVLPAEFMGIDDVVNGIESMQSQLMAARDRRGIFATVYLIMTKTLRDKIRSDFFNDAKWVEQYAVGFAELYRSAFLLQSTGSEALPSAWRLAFETNRSQTALVMQDLLVGINAHINRDLPFAIQSVGVDPREGRYADHTRVNEVLQQATAPVQEAIYQMYAPGLRLVSQALGSLDEDFANFNIDIAREHAWSSAISLHSAVTEADRARIGASIDRGAATLARLIRLPTSDLPFLVPLLKHLERSHHWWDLIGDLI